MSDGTITSEKITINGQEYAPEDAAHLIELGKERQEIESKLNTSLEKVYPEYTRSTQEVKTLKEQMAEKDKQIAELSKPKVEPSTDPEDPINIRKKAVEIGLIDKDTLKKEGYMTRSELDEYYKEKQTNQKLVDSIIEKSRGLEKQIDGSDGRVPYDHDAVLAYASAYNIDDLEVAYDKMNAKGNAKWKEEQLAKEEKPGLTTLRGGGKKEPVPDKVTDANFKEKWDEIMGSGEPQ